MAAATGLLFYKSADDTTALVELRFCDALDIPEVVELNGEKWTQSKVHQLDDGSVEIVFTPQYSEDAPLMVIVEEA